MKILHIINSLKKGGAETNLYKLLKYDNSKIVNKKIYVISLSSHSFFTKKIENLGHTVYNLDIENKYLFFLKIYKIYILIKKINPDIVQTWMYHSCLIGGILAKFAKSKNIIWSIRHSSYKFFKTKFSTIIVIKICSFLSKSIPKKIIYCSRKSMDFHIRIGYEKNKALLIYNGYDKNYFFLKSKNIKIDKLNKITFGIIGRNNPQKDHQNLINSLKFINNDKLINKIEFKFIGKGIKKNKDILKLINRKKIFFKIQLLDHLDDIREAFKYIDFVILPSLYGESFPNILAESMLSGIPCITTDVGESKKIVDKLGWLIPPNNPKQLSESILEAIKVFDNFKQYEILSNECRKHIINNFSEKIMINNYNTMYLNL